MVNLSIVGRLLIVLFLLAGCSQSANESNTNLMKFQDDSVKVFYEDLKDNRQFVMYEEFPYAMHDVIVYYETFKQTKKPLKPMTIWRVFRLITLGIN